MNEEIMRQLGFGARVFQVQKGNCPSCGKAVNPNAKGEFRDECSKREFKISGLCQKCQDETYGS